MKKFTKIALIGMVGFALTACNDSDSPVAAVTPAPPAPPAVVSYEALLNTGVNGYKINVDINDSVNQYSGINYYICTDSAKVFDYFAHDPLDGGAWNLTNLPNFDHGNLQAGAEPTELQFLSDSGMSNYSVDSADENLTEGQTYVFTLWDYFPDAGTIDINSISDFNCSTIVPPAV